MLNTQTAAGLRSRQPSTVQGIESGAGQDNRIVNAEEAMAEITMLRGVTPAAADVSECRCPAACERDHANE